jgi:hypothetical protein
MADVITGNTQLGVTKADILTALVQRELKFNAMLLPWITDVSAFAIKGAKSISFPKFDSFVVATRASAAAGDASVITATQDKLDLNINAYIAYIVDQMDAVQSTVDVDSLFAARAGAAHARYVDTQIIAALETAAGFDLGTAPLTKDLVIAMRQKLKENEANMNDLALLVSPAQESEMLKIAEFTRADAYGSSNIPNGVIGKVYGVPVLVHTGMTSTSSIMFEKSAMAAGFQSGPNYSEQGANQYGALSKRVAIDQLFGLKAMQTGLLGAAAGKSPLIVVVDND